MAQTRYYNYGATLDDLTENLTQYALHPKGVYRGFELSVNTDFNLVMGAGFGLQHDGVVWQEDDERTIVFTAPSIATSYTLVATHTNRRILGGTAVEYTLEEALATNETVTNGIVLGWINHPGSGPLLQEYIIEAPKLAEDDYAMLVSQSLPVELIPPFTRYANSVVGTDITFTDTAFDVGNFLVYEEVSNTPTAIPPVQQLVQNLGFFMQSGLRPVAVEVYVEFASSPSTRLTVELFDTSQAPVTVTGGVIAGSGAWTAHHVDVDQASGTFDDGKPYTVRLTFDVNQGEYIRLGRARVHFWKYF